VAPLDVSLTDKELAEFLGMARTVRVATVGSDGWPHVVPLWFVWHAGTLFVNTTGGNRTVRNAEADPRAAATVDDGELYDELRGVVLRGHLVAADGDSRLAEVGDGFSEKYFGGNRPHFERWRNRMFLRLEPEEIASWDFRKIPDALARRHAERAAGRS
jgi:nitroimidazol reductase NimA-like FMN-containing flavoprotein (pyridoxamine 5'-phosphate oxidase superfamily)